jgi:hypothetical protein
MRRHKDQFDAHALSKWRPLGLLAFMNRLVIHDEADFSPRTVLTIALGSLRKLRCFCVAKTHIEMPIAGLAGAT